MQGDPCCTEGDQYVAGFPCGLCDNPAEYYSPDVGSCVVGSTECALAGGGCAAGVMCVDNICTDPESPGVVLLEAVASQPELSDFLALANQGRGGLPARNRGVGRQSGDAVFAPNNAAVEMIGPAALEALTDTVLVEVRYSFERLQLQAFRNILPIVLLVCVCAQHVRIVVTSNFMTHWTACVQFLLAHVVAQPLPASALSPGATYATLAQSFNDVSVTVIEAQGKLAIEAPNAGSVSTIVANDIAAGDSVVHVIDAPVVAGRSTEGSSPPPGITTVLDILAEDPDLATFYQLVQGARLEGVLRSNSLTVLAPTQAAFAAMDQALLQTYLNTGSTGVEAVRNLLTAWSCLRVPKMHVRAVVACTSMQTVRYSANIDYQFELQACRGLDATCSCGAGACRLTVTRLSTPTSLHQQPRLRTL